MEEKYPALVVVEKILKELIGKDHRNKRYHRYVMSTIQEMHYFYAEISSLKINDRSYFRSLLRKDFHTRIDASSLPENLKSHMRNYITAYYRESERSEKEIS
jgi:hypothetical protein